MPDERVLAFGTQFGRLNAPVKPPGVASKPYEQPTDKGLEASAARSSATGPRNLAISSDQAVLCIGEGPAPRIIYRRTFAGCAARAGRCAACIALPRKPPTMCLLPHLDTDLARWTTRS